MSFAGKNVKFLLGTKDSLLSLEPSSIAAGSFYVTEDTQELFLSIVDGEQPVALGKQVLFYKNWTEISKIDPNTEDIFFDKFYYAQEDNMLLIPVQNKQKINWLQINAAGEGTKLSKVLISEGKTVVDSDTGKKKIVYDITFKQKNAQGVDITPDVTATLEITDDLVTGLSVNVAVGLAGWADSEDDTKAYLQTTGVGANQSDDTTVTLVGTNGITFENNTTVENEIKKNEIVVKGPNHKLKANNKNIEFLINDVRNSKVPLDSDDWIDIGNYEIEENGNKITGLKFLHKDPLTGTDNRELNDDDDPNEETILSTSHEFTAITKVYTDEKGHGVKVEKTKFTMPNTNYTLSDKTRTISTSTEEDGDRAEITEKVQLKRNSEKVSEIDLGVAHLITIDGDEKIVKNGESIGNFYSAPSIDLKLKAVDAMVYKGVTSAQKSLPTANVKIGDTYKAGVALSVLNGVSVTVNVGDLLIANGTEGEDGYITSNTLKWDHIVIGSEDTQYTLYGSDNKITLKDSNSIKKGEIAAVGDDHIDVSVSDNKLTVQHKDVTVTGSLQEKVEAAYGATVNVVTGMTANEAGHLTEVQTTPVKWPGPYSITFGTGDIPEFFYKDDAGQIKANVQFLDGEIIDFSKEISNTTLKITADHLKITSSSDPQSEQTIDNKGTFTAITGLEFDGYGHVTKFTTTPIKLDVAEYSLSGPTLTGQLAKWSFKRDSVEKGSVEIESDSLTLTLDSDKIGINLIWGTF